MNNKDCDQSDDVTTNSERTIYSIRFERHQWFDDIAPKSLSMIEGDQSIRPSVADEPLRETTFTTGKSISYKLFEFK